MEEYLMRRVAFVLVTVITSVAAQAQLEVKELKLSNGMTVWLNEDHSQPKVFGAVVVLTVSPRNTIFSVRRRMRLFVHVFRNILMN